MQPSNPSHESRSTRRHVAKRSSSALRTTKLSTKGQIVIPSDARKRLGWREGDTLIVEEHDGVLQLYPWSAFGPPLAAADVEGRGRDFYKGPHLSLEAIEERTRAALVARHTKESRTSPKKKKKRTS